MIRLKKNVLAILLAAALALSCTACGSSNDTQSTASGSAETATSEESSSQEEETATSTDASEETSAPSPPRKPAVSLPRKRPPAQKKAPMRLLPVSRAAAPTS